MMTRGGEGGKKCRKFDDVICERPLRRAAQPNVRQMISKRKIQKIVDVRRVASLLASVVKQ